MPPELPPAKHAGLALELKALGRVTLTRLLAQHSETEVYYTDHPGVVVKLFDVNCSKPDEVSYGPYMDFANETANFGELQSIEDLRPYIPSYYGANLDYGRKIAFIAMELLEGEDLMAWSRNAASAGFPGEWVGLFQEVIYQTLGIMRLFHQHGIVLTDFKPDNVMRLANRAIRFVDLGAMYTPRHRREKGKFVYSATPDHAEVAIDVSKVQTGEPPGVASDIFSAGVGLFELATGQSRLRIDDRTADEILRCPAMYKFQDSQIKDIWKAFPHLKSALPLLETQLHERRILFADFWHLIKGYVANQMAGWEDTPHDQQDQTLLSTGTTFILEQLPTRLQWLAGPIAQATVLRSLRLSSVDALMGLISSPVSDAVREAVARQSAFVQYVVDLTLPVDFVDRLNTWEVRSTGTDGRWAIAAPVANVRMPASTDLTFLRLSHTDAEGQRFYEVVGDLEADDREGAKMTLWHLRDDYSAWLL